MRVPHYAMRSLAALALIGLMAGCGGNDSTAPDAPFDPAGTSSDIGADGGLVRIAGDGRLPRAPCRRSAPCWASRRRPWRCGRRRRKALVAGGKAGARAVCRHPRPDLHPAAAGCARRRRSERRSSTSISASPSSATSRPTGVRAVRPDRRARGRRAVHRLRGQSDQRPAGRAAGRRSGYADIDITETATSATRADRAGLRRRDLPGLRGGRHRQPERRPPSPSRASSATATTG